RRLQQLLLPVLALAAERPRMRSVLVREFGSPDSLSIEDTAIPPVGPDEVRIEVRATAVNYVDLLVIGGVYQFLPPRPFAPGKLPAGVVAEVGSRVEHLRPGDRVLTLAEHGGYAEQAI